MALNLSYIFLGITVLIALFTTHRKLMIAGLLVTYRTASSEKVVNDTGAFFILILVAISYLFFNYSTKKNFNVFVKGLLLIGITGLTAGFMFHKIPGFNNFLAIEKMHISPLSTPFSMYLNFDKVLAALVIYVTSKFNCCEL